MATSRTTLAPTLRARRRAATTEQIKALARHQLAEHGPGGISLRAIAREIGTASSALYRYFPSQSDLISALCIDAYDSATAALAAARDAAPARDHARAWAGLCHAWRHWALARPADFALIFGTPQPGYQALDDITGPAAARFIRIPVDAYTAAVRAGAADPARTQIPAGLSPGPLWQTLAGDPSEGDPRLASIILSAWTSVLGFLSAEIFGSLTELISDTGALYQAHLHAVMLGMGFQPELAEQAVTSQT